MRAKMKSKIRSVSRVNGFVYLELELEGKVIVGGKSAEAKDARMIGKLVLKPVVADDIKIGSVLTVEVNDEEPDSRIE